MAPADTIIKNVSERPNGMFPLGSHVRTYGTSVTHSSGQENLILGKSGNISENPKIFRKIRKYFGFSEIFFPKYFGIFCNVIGKSEIFSDFPKTSQNILVFRKKVTAPHSHARLGTWTIEISGIGQDMQHNSHISCGKSIVRDALESLLARIAGIVMLSQTAKRTLVHGHIYGNE